MLGQLTDKVVANFLNKNDVLMDKVSVYDFVLKSDDSAAKDVDKVVAAFLNDNDVLMKEVTVLDLLNWAGKKSG